MIEQESDTEDFYVWSHHQRRAGLPFDWASWQKAREKAKAQRSNNDEKAKAASCY